MVYITIGLDGHALHWQSQGKKGRQLGIAICDPILEILQTSEIIRISN